MPPKSDLPAAFARHQAGDLDAAEALYRQALAEAPDDINGLQLLGLLLLDTGRAAEAVELLERAVAGLEQAGGAQPAHALLYNNLGNALLAAGRGGEAAGVYRRGLALDPDRAELHANLAVELLAEGDAIAAAAAWADLLRLRPGEAEELCALAAGAVPGNIPAAAAAPAHLRLAEACGAAGTAFAGVAARILGEADAHVALARLLRGSGEPQAAEAEYRAAHPLEPGHANAMAHLASLLLEGERYAELAEVCTRLLGVDPDHPGALCTLGAAQSGLGDRQAALASYLRCVELKPDFAAAHRNLGMLFARMGLDDDAVACLERAISLAPDDSGAFAELGNVLQLGGQPERARACFLRARQLRPLVTWPAAGKARFAVLVLTAPGAGNTPMEYLVGKAGYDAHFVNLLAGLEPDLELLRGHGDVVLNLISDVDGGGDMLAIAADLVARLGKPVVNHPARILATGRDAVARALAGIPGCRVPPTLRVKGADMPALSGFSAPLLVRRAGCHGGDEFEKVAGPAEAAAIAGRRPESEYYVSQYVDTRSPDGYFRKYRVFFVDGEVLPYHLAIGRQWKLHYFRTDMARHPWMRREEEDFLQDPARVLGDGAMAALPAIRAAVGLDFFGMDFALDRSGDLVVFEANATMRVHGDTGAQAYKDPYARRIKQAFDALLEKAARAGLEDWPAIL